MHWNDINIAALCAAHGLAVRATSAVVGGHNSATLRLHTTSGDFLLKRYRDGTPSAAERMEREFSAIEALQRAGITPVPQPQFADARTAIACYEFIEHRRFTSDDITPPDVDTAADFFQSLATVTAPGPHQRLAVDACPRLHDHHALIAQRIDALRTIPWARDILCPAWEQAQRTCADLATAHQIALHSHLAADSLIFSASDVGFHNIIRDTQHHRLVFVDFEYAGFDDPAKLLCDFLLQPGVPLPRPLHERFVRRFLRQRADAHQIWWRARCLAPLLAIKWCTIVIKRLLAQGVAPDDATPCDAITTLLHLAHHALPPLDAEFSLATSP